MQPNQVYYLILGILVWEFIFTKTIGYLNTTYWSETLPPELSSIYDNSKYSMSQKYEKEKYKFWLFSSSFSFFLILWALVGGFFAYLDNFLLQHISNPILVSLSFFGILVILQTCMSIPFDYYAMFQIEERYWFNKSSKALFFWDLCKWLALSLLIWWILLGAVIWIFQNIWPNFWIYAWALLTFFSIFMMMFYSSIIVPLFNKQTPLEDGELKKAISDFAAKVGFKLDNIYVIDGSKRSSKANAYFTGLWKKKRIVLYDTLIKDLSTEEIVAVLAHEIGHYKKKHTLQILIFSIIQTGLMLYILWLALNTPEVSYSLGAKISSFHMWALAFSLLFTPISIILWVLANMISRKNEYEADAYASENYWAKFLQDALKKLSINNLSNLRPHPVYEFFHYSHPTVLRRLEAMNMLIKK